MSSKIAAVLDNMEQGNAMDAVTSIISLLNDTGTEELRSIREFGDAMRAAEQTEVENQNQAQDIIKGLLALKDQEEAAIEASPEVAQNKDAEKALADTCQEVEKIQNEVQAAQKEKYEQEEMQARLVEQRETVKEETTHVLPKTRYNISLYKCITGISWDYECPTEQIKGFVSTKTDVRPFSLSTQQNSKYFITNYLWDLVGTASETK